MSTLINLAGSGLATGIIGIPNGSGWYTFYASLNLALAAATSGDTIVFFDDFTESTSGSTLVDGVDINLNGHTYTLDTVDTQSVFTATAAGAVSCTFYNGKIVRSGGDIAVSETDTNVFRLDGSNKVIRFEGVEVLNSSDALIVYATNGSSLIRGTFEGLGSTNLGRAAEIVGNIENSTWSIGSSLRIVSGFAINCTVSNAISGIALELTGSNIINSYVYAFSGLGIQASSSNIKNCTIISEGSSGVVLNNSSLLDSCSAEALEIAVTINSSSIVKNSTLVCGENTAVELNAGEIHNSHMESTGESVLSASASTVVGNCTIKSTRTISAPISIVFLNGTGIVIKNCNIQSNLTGTIAIDGVLGSTTYLSNTSCNLATFINGTNVTNVQVNTSDNYGNITTN